MSKTLLVIPHYRDSERLAPFLEELRTTLPDHFSILVSDDGSGETEAHNLQRLISKVREKAAPGGSTLLDPLMHSPNTGKGGAVRRGWMQGADYAYLAFADADGAVSAGEILRADKHMRAEAGGIDALFGSRVKMLGRTINRSPVRHVSGRVFATLVSVVADLTAYDTQCGLKILTQDSFRKVESYMKSYGFAFDVELCLLLLKTGCRVQEFPLDWRDVPGSKISLLRDSIRMAADVLRIRRRIEAIHF